MHCPKRKRKKKNKASNGYVLYDYIYKVVWEKQIVLRQSLRRKGQEKSIELISVLRFKSTF